VTVLNELSHERELYYGERLGSVAVRAAAQSAA
jgi:hypothetical protein